MQKNKHRSTLGFFCALIAFLLLPAASAFAHPTTYGVPALSQPSPSCFDIAGSGNGAQHQMTRGQALGIDQCIEDAALRYELIMQGDGNLVLYDGDMGPIWASNTPGSGASIAVMQGDGNLVLYTPAGRAVWASNTNGLNNSTLILQMDGNLVIYAPTPYGTYPVWASGTSRR